MQEIHNNYFRSKKHTTTLRQVKTDKYECWNITAMYIAVKLRKVCNARLWHKSVYSALQKKKRASHMKWGKKVHLPYFLFYVNVIFINDYLAKNPMTWNYDEKIKLTLLFQIMGIVISKISATWNFSPENSKIDK